LSGRGTCTFANGDRYTGEFRASRPHGVGSITYRGGRTVSGQFRNGRPISNS